MNQQNNLKKENVTLIKIDLWSVLKIILIFLGFLFLYLIKDIILMVLAGILLAAIINPGVNFLERKKIPRWLGALIIYLIIFLIISLTIFAAGSTIRSQFHLFINKMPIYLKSFFQTSQNDSEMNFLEFFNKWLNKGVPGGNNIFSLLGSVAGQLFTSAMIFVIAFYLSIEKHVSNFFIDSIIPVKYKKIAREFIDTSGKEIGAWARATIFLSLLTGVLTYLALLLLGIKFALVLGFLAVMGEFIPYLGPWMAGAPAVLIALAQSPTKAILVAVVYIIIQHAGNTFIAPPVMRRVVGLDPLLVIIVLLIGGQIAGPWGLILAVPTTIVIIILIKSYLKIRRNRQVN